MSKGRKIQATFSDGRTISRTTTLPLTHAWRFWGTYPDGSSAGCSGFASSAELAAKAIVSDSADLRNGYYSKHERKFTRGPGKMDGQEIVPAVEV